MSVCARLAVALCALAVLSPSPSFAGRRFQQKSASKAKQRNPRNTFPKRANPRTTLAKRVAHWSDSRRFHPGPPTTAKGPAGPSHKVVFRGRDVLNIAVRVIGKAQLQRFRDGKVHRIPRGWLVSALRRHAGLMRTLASTPVEKARKAITSVRELKARLEKAPQENGKPFLGSWREQYQAAKALEHGAQVLDRDAAATVVLIDAE